jgi:hypothetical protein
MRLKLTFPLVGGAIGLMAAVHFALLLPELLEVSLGCTVFGLVLLFIWWAKGGAR